MKLLHIAAHLGGGAGKAISGMAALQAIDNEVKILLLEMPKDRKYIEVLNGKVEIIYPDSTNNTSELIEKSDVVIVNWWCHPLMVRFLACFPEAPCRAVLWCHVNGCSYPYLPFDFLDRFLKVVFTSEFSFENRLWTRGEKHKIWSKSALVYGMGNYQPANVSPKTDYSRGNDFVVGYIGTVNYGKIANDFVEYCLAAVQKKKNIRFVVVGNPAPDVVNDIKNSEVCEKVEFVGAVDDPEPYYKSFDVFGYLLSKDSFATTENALLEAMAFGLPIIVKDNSVEERIIHDGLNGYVVRNKEEYADELEYLYDNPEECSRIGEKARKYCLRVYRHHENKEVFDKVLFDVVNERKRSYRFEDIVGKEPIDWFLSFTGDDRKLFEDFLNKQSAINKARLMECKPIYKEKTKSSVLHFFQYFSCDAKLGMIADSILGKDN